jgi:hypothetical protein
MSMLEEKIRKNRDLFDGAEPSDGHFDRFQSRLGDLQTAIPVMRKRYASRFFRIAAVIVVLLALSVTYYLINPDMNSSLVSAGTLPREIQEARMYYNKQAEEKLQKINECAASTSEASYIQKIVEDEIILLDSSSVQLEQQLQSDKENKRLINALLKNYKTKSDLLDDILNKLCHI